MNGACMDSGVFPDWLSMVCLLTPGQRQQAFMALGLAEANDASDEDAIALVCSLGEAVGFAVAGCEEAGREIVGQSRPGVLKTVATTLTAAAQGRVETRGCPYCDEKNVRPWGRASNLPRYRCSNCRRTFNALTGTPLAHLRHKDRWPDQAQALMSGESVAEAAARCGVAYTTAFRWRHRFLVAPALDKPTRLVGIVEADETFILESFKGRRADLPRASRKRGGKPKKTGLSAEQIPVLVARDRAGTTIDGVLPKLDRASVTAVLAGVVTSDNEVCCDGGKAIAAFARAGGIPYHVLPKPGRPKPEAPHLHINNVNAYHSRLKEWLRPFHGVATKNLTHYLGWRRTLETIGHTGAPGLWLSRAMGIGAYR